MSEAEQSRADFAKEKKRIVTIGWIGSTIPCNLGAPDPVEKLLSEADLLSCGEGDLVGDDLFGGLNLKGRR